MSRTESRTTVEKVTVTGFRCDGCGKYEPVKESIYSAHVQEPEGWVSFWSGHHDYPEADDDRERHEVCSFACYAKVFRNLIAENTKWGGMPRTFTADGKDEAFMRALVETLPDESGLTDG